MPRKVRWRELRVGAIGAAAVVAAVLAILLFARVGALHGSKSILYVATPDATGILKGSEVWLGGKKIGLVKGVRFRPVSSDTTGQLIIESEVLEEYLPQVRRDSRADIRAGGSLIGAPVVSITGGTLSSPPLRDGDTIHTVTDVKITDLSVTVTSAHNALSGLITETKALATKVQSPTGTVGSVMTKGMPQMTRASATFSRLSEKAMHGRGTVGLAMRGAFSERVSTAMARVDSVHSLVSGSSGNIGRFRKDSTLLPRAREVMAEVDSLRMMAGNPVGTIGRAHSDSTLIRKLAESRAVLDSLIRDIKSHPLRYISF